MSQTPQEALLGHGLHKQNGNQRLQNRSRQFVKTLMLKGFSKQSQCLLGIVTTKVVNLCNDGFSVAWHEFIDKDVREVAIGLSQVSCVADALLRVWNWINHSLESNPRSMVCGEMAAMSGLVRLS